MRGCDSQGPEDLKTTKILKILGGKMTSDIMCEVLGNVRQIVLTSLDLSIRLKTRRRGGQETNKI